MNEISSELMRKFLNDEIIEMKKYREDKNREAGRDLGQGPVFEWINQYSQSFRENWFKNQEGG